MCEVIEDVSFTGRERLTCIICDVTLIRQPWMTNWAQRKSDFLETHPQEEELENGQK